MQKEKRRFEKYFTRQRPLVHLEYWYQGERYEMPKQLDGLLYFDPLFIFQPKKGVEVYYEVNNPHVNEVLLIPYLLSKPDKFRELIEIFNFHYDALRNLRNTRNPGSFKSAFEHAVGLWPTLSLVDLLGSEFDESELGSIVKEAFNFRSQTHLAAFEVMEIVLGLAREIVPQATKDINFLTSSEIVLRRAPDKDLVESRQRGYIYFGGNIFTDCSVSDFISTRDIVLESPNKNSQTVKVLKGQIAEKGKVVGRVKLVGGNDDINLFKRGEILVSIMTSPTYLPIMKKAAAFVTDEGGITCHAAIVSRELKKPCIIGTKIATQVLKDGDLVEVDAEQGIVKILERV